MKISDFSDILKSCSVAGYKYRAQGLTAYTADKQVEDIFLFIPPRNWSIIWREHCTHTETVQLLLGKQVPLRQSGKEQYINLAPLDAREALIVDAEKIMKALQGKATVNVLNDGLVSAEFLENYTTNAMVYLRWSITIELTT